MAEYAKKDNIRPPRPITIKHADKGDFKKPQPKSKAEIVKEKSLVTKQNIKEKEKASTKKEKTDLDANKKTETKTIHSSKGIDVEVKKKPKKKKGVIAKIKDYFDADKEKPGFQFTKPKKAKAAEVKIKKKPLSPEQKKKDKAIMKAEEARRAKGKSLKAKQDSAAIMKAEKDRRAKAKKAAKKKADAKRADIRDVAKAKSKETVKSGKSSAAPGGKTYEDRVKALVAKKGELSKKETADGRSEYQVQMNKLKKENKKAWKEMFKGGKLKG
jgi:hypothetical protein